MFQKTIKNSKKIVGIGLHTGKTFEIIFYPSDANSGVIFKINNQFIKAKYFNVKHTQLATKICKNNICILTPEHLLSAIRGIGIDNIIIEIKNFGNEIITKNNEIIYEIPIMDGSSYPFIMMLKNECKIEEQNALKQFLYLKNEIVYNEINTDKYIKIKPKLGLNINYGINFAHPMIGEQWFNFKYSINNYIEQISRARTFGFLKEIQYLKNLGLIQGGGLDNAIVLDDKGILNENLRFPDEFVRHKILDLIGDLSLTNYFILGNIEGYKTSHSINNKFLTKLLNNKENYEILTFKKNEISELENIFELKKVISYI